MKYPYIERDISVFARHTKRIPSEYPQISIPLRCARSMILRYKAKCGERKQNNPQ